MVLLLLVSFIAVNSVEYVYESLLPSLARYQCFWLLVVWCFSWFVFVGFVVLLVLYCGLLSLFVAFCWLGFALLVWLLFETFVCLVYVGFVFD